MGTNDSPKKSQRLLSVGERHAALATKRRRRDVNPQVSGSRGEVVIGDEQRHKKMGCLGIPFIFAINPFAEGCTRGSSVMSVGNIVFIDGVVILGNEVHV